MSKLQNIDWSLKYIAILIFVTYLTQFASIYLSSHVLIRNVWRLFTSPINSYFEGDYANNIVFVFIALTIIEIYLRNTKRIEVFKFWFLSSILASYIVALDWIVLHGIAAAGSSIVCGSLILVLAFYLCVDGVRKLAVTSQQTTIVNFICYVLAIFFTFFLLIFYYGAYIKENNSWILHILGFIGTVVMFYFGFKRIRKRDNIRIL